MRRIRGEYCRVCGENMTIGERGFYCPHCRLSRLPRTEGRHGRKVDLDPAREHPTREGVGDPADPATSPGHSEEGTCETRIGGQVAGDS